MHCEERERLWRLYNAALSTFSLAVDELTESIKDTRFTDRIHRAQETNSVCKTARAAWEQHIRDHECSG
jgi:hypothetical protein